MSPAPKPVQISKRDLLDICDAVLTSWAKETDPFAVECQHCGAAMSVAVLPMKELVHDTLCVVNKAQLIKNHLTKAKV
jgi:hypothetical protein